MDGRRAVARARHELLRSRYPASRRRGIFTWPVVLIGLGLAAAWGTFLWLVIGGSIASFGNPWPQ